jgi:hypothetical protein
MIWRRSHPLCPNFGRFLFATIGDKAGGMPLSVLSALVRLGLDPWEEAGRLSSLRTREAVEQLARLIAELPELSRPLQEARAIAKGLIGLLPKHGPGGTSAPQVQIRPRYRAPALAKFSEFWVAWFVLAAAILISAVIHGGFPFGIKIP